MTKEELLNTMSDFLLNEPSGDLQLLDDHIHLTKYNGLGKYEIEKIAKVANEFDESGKLSLIYLASLCRDQIANTIAPVSDLLNNPNALDKYRKCLECINSQEITDCRSEIVGQLAAVISSVSEKKVIGKTDAIDSILDGALHEIFDEFGKLKFEIYTKTNNPVGTLTNTALTVQVCNSLAECLIRLERSIDGIYICFISNPGTLDGWFGFFVKSNGNLFSYNERIDEVYVGQHGHLRNGRYAEHGKAYGLFPYELCEFSDETDYKGYSLEMKIGENRDLFNGDNLEMASRVFLTMALIAQRHSGRKIHGKRVIVNSLLQSNLARLEGSDEKSIALVVWQGASIVKATAKFEVPKFEDEKVVKGEYDNEFNSNNRYGVFCGINQDILDVYGQDFHADYGKVLASDSSRRLLGDGNTEQEFIGSPERLKLQAYYEVRKQLAKHVLKKLKDDFNSFGGGEGLEKWYKERLAERMDVIYRFCIAAYLKSNGEEETVEFGEKKLQKNSCSSSFAATEFPMEVDVHKKYRYCKTCLSEFKDNALYCPITNTKASYVFTFSFDSYTQVQDFLRCPLPKFCTGWRKNKLYNGNCLLDVTDPVGNINHPISSISYPFNFTVALSKTAIKRLQKEIKENPMPCHVKGEQPNPAWEALAKALSTIQEETKSEGEEAK